ncbi:MAG: hypothetical protein ACKOUT_16155 [Novosphingobium sp.]
MKLQRKALVRNLVIAMVVADGVGVYVLQDRLSNPLNDSASAFEQEALALSASEPAKPQFLPPHATVPQSAVPQQAEASRELPKPAFGMDAPARAENVKVSAPQPAAAPVAAKAAFTAKVAAPAATLAARASPAATLTAKRSLPAPRAMAAATTRTPVTLSVTPSSSAKSAMSTKHEHKRGSFTKAFGVSRAAPSALAVTTASGSLHHAGPVITADFGPDATQPVTDSPEVTSTLAMVTSVDTATTDQAPARDSSAPVASEPAPSELPPSIGE